MEALPSLSVEHNHLITLNDCWSIERFKLGYDPLPTCNYTTSILSNSTLAGASSSRTSFTQELSTEITITPSTDSIIYIDPILPTPAEVLGVTIESKRQQKEQAKLWKYYL